MLKKFSTIRDNVAVEVYDTSTNMLNRISNYINIRYEDILRRFNVNLYNYDYSFTTTAGTSDYALPSDYGKCIGALDNTNNKELGDLVSLEKIYRNNPTELTTQGNPTNYVTFNSPVMKQPSTAAIPAFVSSSTSDTTQKIFIRGLLASGAEVTESVSLNGTTSVPAVNSYKHYKQISKDGDTVGTITGTHGSDNITVLSPKVLTSKYTIMRLWYTPNTTLTIKFPYVIKPLPLIEDDDYPLLDIENILEIGAKASAHSYQRREATANKYESIYETMIANYIWDDENQPNRVVQFQPEPYTRTTT